MLCQNCQLRQATTKFEKVINGRVYEINLCNKCARQFYSGFNFNPTGDFSNDEKIDIRDFLSKRASDAFETAAKKAISTRNKNIDTEHILFALLQNDEVMNEIFNELKIEKSTIENEIENELITGDDFSEEPGFTPRAKRVIELALEEARMMQHNYIGTEHLFLAIIREKEGLAAQILSRFGISYDDARKAVLKVIGEGKKEKDSYKSKSKTPVLDKFSRDLTAIAKEGKIDPVIGRGEEITRVIEILSRRKKNNPVLIGEPGVGKTAIAEGLAQRIVSENVPDILKNKKIKALDIGLLIAGSKFRGEFEERAKKIIDELEKSNREIIVFIDELHTIVGSGAQEGQMDLSNLLKPALARGDIQVIGATTIGEYKKYIEKDPALERRFQPVLIEEPSVAQTIEILKGVRDKYEAHHRIKISDDAIAMASELSDKFIKDRFLPDKALDVIDEAASHVRINATSEPDDLRNKKHEIKKLEAERESLSMANQHEQAALLKQRIENLKAEIKPLEDQWLKKRGTGTPEVKKEDIAEVISRMTGIPVTELNEQEKEKLTNLEKRIHERVIGQDEAVIAVSNAIRRARIGLKNPKRPIASFLFLGPTGVGKTELAKALAEQIFGNENALVRIDMSEYMEKHTVARLIGAPPGYIGYEEGGQLTEKIRRHPYSVILLDEIEKAHPDVFNILLQILEDGILTDGKGRTVDFKNTILIATSNIGAQIILEYLKKSDHDQNKLIQFKETKEDQSWDILKQKLNDEIRKYFKIEFINRIDDIIIFHPLSRKDFDKIIDLEFAKTKKLLAKQGISIKIDKSAKERLAQIGYDPTFGARPLRRAIQKEIENKLADLIISNKFKKGDKINISFKKDNFEFKKI